MPVLTAAIIHACAAFAQAGIGAALLIRAGRKEIAALLGHLFLINATISALQWMRVADVHLPGISQRIGAQIGMLDAATNILILWMALAYPRRVRWLPPRAAWTAPIVALGIAVIADALSGGLRRVRNAGGLDGWEALLGYGVFDIAFAILLLRWSAAWINDVDVPRKEFMLLFAVFGMRAMHLSIIVPTVEFMEIRDGRPVTWSAAVLLAILGCFVVGAAIIAMTRLLVHTPPARREALHNTVIVFFIIGVAEGILNGTVATWRNIDWWNAFTLRYDSLIARVGMVWLAFPGLLGNKPLHDRWVMGIVAGIGAASISWAVAPSALLVGLGAATVTGFLISLSMDIWMPAMGLWEAPARREAGPHTVR